MMIVPMSQLEEVWKVRYQESLEAEKQRRVERLRKQAEKLGYELVLKKGSR